MELDRRFFLGQAAALGAAPSASLTARLKAAVDQATLYDTHEHLLFEKVRTEQEVDFFTLAGHYAMNEVISAGLGGEELARVRDPKAPLADRWRAFEPFWRSARYTGYGQALRIAMRDIYGTEISGQSIGRLNEAIRAANKPGLYSTVLREKARIDWCLVDTDWTKVRRGAEPDYFLRAQRFDAFVTPASRRDVERLEKSFGVAIHTLADFRLALERRFDKALESGMVAVKSALAYRRDLLFREVAEPDAARDWERLMKGNVEPPKGFRSAKQRPFRDLEDHMFHQVVRLAEALRVPIQIHTGLLAGNSCFVENTSPVALTNLFYLYPAARFDLFHIGYPYQEELGVLVKLFPNVYVDFCWAHIISPPAARRALDVWIETVPLNKILGFGGDYRFPELTYAHARMARQNIAQVLAGKVEAGLFDEAEAAGIGRMLLRDNALSLFPPPRTRAAERPDTLPTHGC